MKIGEKKLTKGSDLTGSGGSGGAYSSKGSFLKAIGKKFGFGKRTSKQEKAEAAWKLSLGEKKPMKKSKEIESRSFDKKEMEKAKELNRVKKLKEKQKDSVAKERKAERNRRIVNKMVQFAINKEFVFNRHVKGWKIVPYAGLAAYYKTWAAIASKMGVFGSSHQDFSLKTDEQLWYEISENLTELKKREEMNYRITATRKSVKEMLTKFDLL